MAGGAVAYAAATVAVTLGLVVPSLRRNVVGVSRENARWFVYSGIFVAAAHGFLYSALAVAPIMLVAPLLQLSLVFRFLFALLLNPHHEVFGRSRRARRTSLAVGRATGKRSFGVCGSDEAFQRRDRAAENPAGHACAYSGGVGGCRLPWALH